MKPTVNDRMKNEDREPKMSASLPRIKDDKRELLKPSSNIVFVPEWNRYHCFFRNISGSLFCVKPDTYWDFKNRKAKRKAARDTRIELRETLRDIERKRQSMLKVKFTPRARLRDNLRRRNLRSSSKR